MHIGLVFVIMGIMMGSWSTWYGWRNIWEDMTVLMKFTTLSIWAAAFLFFLVETKMYYRIDIFKGVDTPIDQVYGDVRRELNSWYRTL